MGRITTFRRVRKYHPLLNSYDWNDCLSVETTKTEKVVTLWAYVGQEERLMVTMTDEQKGLFFSYNDCFQEFKIIQPKIVKNSCLLHMQLHNKSGQINSGQNIRKGVGFSGSLLWEDLEGYHLGGFGKRVNDGGGIL